jgi:mono/diheme cytochrome c family protein
MRTLFITLFALVLGFLAGLIISELLAIAGLFVTGQPYAVRYLPIILGGLSAAAALFASLILRRRMQSASARPRRNWLWITGGCAMIALCGVTTLTLNAGYWILARDLAHASTDGANTAPASAADLPAGEPGRGQQVFDTYGCQACHSLTPGDDRTGPSLAGLSQRAASAFPGYTAEQYVYESIIDPEAHLAPGYGRGLMPSNYGSRLTPQQLADLLAFLLDQ